MKSKLSGSLLLILLLIPSLTACGTSKSDATDIALAHAGYTAEEVQGLHAEYDNDDGISKYEVRFFFENIEYEYDIDAESGDILTVDKDIEY